MLSKEKARVRRDRKYREENPEKVKESKKKWADKNPNYNKEYYQKHKDKIKAQVKKYAEDNPDKVKKSSKEYYKKHKDKISRKGAKWALDNPEKVKEAKKKYHDKNREKINKDKRLRRASDPVYAAKDIARGRLNEAIKSKGFSKRSSTLEMIGCSYEELVSHLESTFTDGMSWDNRSEWHVDHIVPLSSAKTIEEVEDLAHYTNTQALWAEDNLKKGSKC